MRGPLGGGRDGRFAMLYLRFVVCLAVGLAGMCLALKTLLDGFFGDWDIAADLQRSLRRPRRPGRAALSGRLSSPDFEPQKLSTRLYQPGRREPALDDRGREPAPFPVVAPD